MESLRDLSNRLTVILPIFEQAAENGIRNETYGGEIWETSSQVYSRIGLLLQTLEALKSRFGTKRFAGESDCKRILRELTESLDRMVLGGRELLKNLSYPGLVALTRRDDPLTLLPPFSKIHGAWIKQIDAWTDELGKLLQQTPRKKGPAREINRLAAALHRALCQCLRCCRCACPSIHQCLLLMASHHNFAGESDDDIAFGILFSGASAGSRKWHEAQVKVQVTIGKPRPSDGCKSVRFEPATPRPAVRPISNICNYVQRHTPAFRLNLQAEQDGLSESRRKMPPQLEEKVLSSAEIVSLDKILDHLSDQPVKLLDDASLTKLAILLANSFLHLDGGPWIPGKLNKSSIQFLVTKENLLLIPFLPLRLGGSKLGGPDIETPHEEESIMISGRGRIALGVLLIELFRQSPIEKEILEEDKPLQSGSTEITEEYFAANRILDEFAEDNEILLFDAIDACLENPTEILHRDKFYEMVIEPLEKRLSEKYGIKPAQVDPAIFKDPIVSLGGPILVTERTIDAGPVLGGRAPSPFQDAAHEFLQMHSASATDQQQFVPRTLSKLSVPTTLPNTIIHAPASNLSDTMQPQARWTPQDDLKPVKQPKIVNMPLPNPQQPRKGPHKSRKKGRNKKFAPPQETNRPKLSGGLFTNKDPTMQSQSEEWFSYFDRVHDFLDNIKIPEWAQTTNPVKIAVLDTGVNFGDPWIQLNKGKGRIKSKSFIEGGVCDTDGHGTHIAGLLLKVARNATVYAARVARSHENLDEDAIAKAIQHAINNWKVDIISMSFGYDCNEPTPPKIYDAIGDARKAKVLMFAAGHNYGSNESIAFPANQPEVICVGSTNYQGVRSSFTPMSDGNFHFRTFGEEVVSSGVQKTGTSFATPIAAGIAAIALDYLGRMVDEEFYPYPPRLLTEPERLAERTERLKLIEKAKTLNGMKAVLKQWSERQDDGCYYIAPWKKLHLRRRDAIPSELITCLIPT